MLNTERIALPVTAGLKTAAKEAAEREGRPMANFCRRAIMDALPEDLYQHYVASLRDDLEIASSKGGSA